MLTHLGGIIIADVVVRKGLVETKDVKDCCKEMSVCVEGNITKSGCCQQDVNLVNFFKKGVGLDRWTVKQHFHHSMTANIRLSMTGHTVADFLNHKCTDQPQLH